MSSTEQPKLPAGVNPDVGTGPSISLEELIARSVAGGSRVAIGLFCKEAVAAGVPVETVNEIIDRVHEKMIGFKEEFSRRTDILGLLIEGKEIDDAG